MPLRRPRKFGLALSQLNICDTKSCLSSGCSSIWLCGVHSGVTVRNSFIFLVARGGTPTCYLGDLLIGNGSDRGISPQRAQQQTRCDPLLVHSADGGGKKS